jgi:hypothetical protein
MTTPISTVISNLQTALATAQSFGGPPPPVAPTISSFVASPASLPAGGGSVTLSAMIGGTPAPTLTINGAAATLPATFNITASTTFVLVATNSAGTINSSVTVQVSAASGGRFANLPPNTARNLGPYANPDPQFNSNGLRAASIVDDSGFCAEIIADKIYLRGGGHGPSQETTIWAFDLNTLTWSKVHESTNVSDMTVANIDVG